MPNLTRRRVNISLRRCTWFLGGVIVTAAIAGCSGTQSRPADNHNELVRLEERLTKLEERLAQLSADAARRTRREAGFGRTTQDLPRRAQADMRTWRESELDDGTVRADELPNWGGGFSAIPRAEHVLAQTAADGVTLGIVSVTRWGEHAVYDLVLSSSVRTRVSFPEHVIAFGLSDTSYRLAVSAGPDADDMYFSRSRSTVRLEPNQPRRAFVVQLHAGKEESLRAVTFWGAIEGQSAKWDFGSLPIDE